MESLSISTLISGEKYNLIINKINGYFEIIHRGKIVAALRPPGEDWQILELEELLTELPVYENDLKENNNQALILTAPVINQITAAIESHIQLSTHN